jgi:SAM-dependent methyltransferase
MNRQQIYWDNIADDYQRLTNISTLDFHFGPLLPGDSELKILPEIRPEMRCFEAGCGAAQNSIYLAKHGAACTAVDVSPCQIEHARQLAHKNGVSISLLAGPLEEEQCWPTKESFDLVHSVYALPFIATPQAFIQRAADLLVSGGTLVLATQHPVFCAEWLELEDEELGLFLPSYFEPPEDIRQNEDGSLIASRAYPIASISQWFWDAGLRNLRLWEPQPLPLTRIHQAPYHSPAWIELHPKLRAAPVSAIYRAEKA